MIGRSLVMLCAVVVAASACSLQQTRGASEVDDAAPGAEARASAPAFTIPDSGRAVVRIGAQLHAAPRPGHAIDVLQQPGANAVGVTVDVVGEENGFVVVETLSADDVVCAGRLGGFEAFRLRLFVLPDDLMDVTTSRVDRQFSDGTSIRLAPGVPVAEDYESQVIAAGTRIELPLPKGRIGKFYAPAPVFAATGSTGTLADLGHEQTLRYDGDREMSEQDLYTRDNGLAYFGATPRPGSESVVTVRNPCMEATVRVPRTRVRADQTPFAGRVVATGDVSPGGRASFRVKADVELAWADGSAAGRTAAAYDLASAPLDRDGRKCFDVAWGPSDIRSSMLCVAAAHVEDLRAVGGYGRGGFGSRVPRVKQGKAKVKGPLDADIVRRIVRAHINEVRHCYNQGLVKNANLKGSVVVEFTIDAMGNVEAARIADSTVPDERVGQCMAAAFERWKFPKPEREATVAVRIPFELESGDPG